MLISTRCKRQTRLMRVKFCRFFLYQGFDTRKVLNLAESTEDVNEKKKISSKAKNHLRMLSLCKGLQVVNTKLVLGSSNK